MGAVEIKDARTTKPGNDVVQAALETLRERASSGEVREEDKRKQKRKSEHSIKDLRFWKELLLFCSIAQMLTPPFRSLIY